MPTHDGKTETWNYGKEGAAARAATAVRYDRESRKFTLELANGTAFIFPADHCQGLNGASDEDLAAVELTPGGYGLHWEVLDADLGIAGLLQGYFGGPAWMERFHLRNRES